MTQQISLGQSGRADEAVLEDGIREIAPDLAYRRLVMVNVVFYGSPDAGDRGWVLVDTGVVGTKSFIVSAAAARFGKGARPSAIVLTHGHFDHVGALEDLATEWDVPVYAHKIEQPYLDGSAAYPPGDPEVGGGLMAKLSPLYPTKPVDVSTRLRALPEDGTVPDMPGWRWIHTPGHSAGHVSLWREGDRALIVGDAFVTTAAESAYATITQAPELHGPPRYYTTDWDAARASVEALAKLDPDLVITGHGRAMQGAEMRDALHALARDFDRVAVPEHGLYLDRPARAEDGTAYRPVQRPQAPGNITNRNRTKGGRMSPRLKPIAEQVIVITGASSGIGLATARMAAKRGARLVLAARSGGALGKLVEEIQGQGGQAVSVVADVCNEDDVSAISKAAQDRFGGFDTWINDAGIGMYGRLDEVALADMRKLFDTNFWGLIHGSLEAVKHLKHTGGALINLGSEVSERAVPLQGIYSASKHAVKGFTDALRMELEDSGAPISVTLVKPGQIDTPFTVNAKNYLASEPHHVPPVYAPEAVAETILSCAERPVRDILVGGGAKGMAQLGHFAPGLTDVVMNRMVIPGTPSGRPSRRPPDQSGLDVPTESLKERGNYEGHVMRTSLYTRAALHPVVTGAAVLGVGLAIGALMRGSSKGRVRIMAADKRLFEGGLRLLLGAHHQGSAQAARNRDTSTHPKLRHMVSAGSKANLVQAKRLEQVFDALGATPYRRHDAGMQGICDANEAEIAGNKSPASRDLLNIAYGQVAAHFYIARYDTLRSTARALGYGKAVKLLGKTLDETYAIDREFTRLYEHLIGRRSVSHYPGEGALRATAAMHPALTFVVLGSAVAATALIGSSLGARRDPF